MPVDTQTVRDGDPTIQMNGEYRGTVTYTYTDTSDILEKTLRANGLDSWNALLLSDIPVSEEQMRKRNAMEAGQDPDEPLPDDSSGEASNLDILVGKLRAGYAIYDSTDSYRYTNQVDIWRANKGYTWGQIWNQIESHPEYNMTLDEYTNIIDRWTYLDTPGKIATMKD